MGVFTFCVWPRAFISLEFPTNFQLKPSRVFHTHYICHDSMSKKLILNNNTLSWRKSYKKNKLIKFLNSLDYLRWTYCQKLLISRRQFERHRSMYVSGYVQIQTVLWYVGAWLDGWRIYVSWRLLSHRPTGWSVTELLIFPNCYHIHERWLIRYLMTSQTSIRGNYR